MGPPALEARRPAPAVAPLLLRSEPGTPLWAIPAADHPMKRETTLGSLPPPCREKERMLEHLEKTGSFPSAKNEALEARACPNAKRSSALVFPLVFPLAHCNAARAS